MSLSDSDIRDIQGVVNPVFFSDFSNSPSFVVPGFGREKFAPDFQNPVFPAGGTDQCNDLEQKDGYRKQNLMDLEPAEGKSAQKRGEGQESQGEAVDRIKAQLNNAPVKNIYGFPEIIRQVTRGTRISSDEWPPYRVLSSLGYDHNTVDHRAKNWANGDTHVNTLEAFWSMLKRSIRGTHIHVSRKHLLKYLGEFEFRYNLRKRPDLMFARLLANL